jgi:hypothetical protein
MRSDKTLDEARKYLLYVADALQSVAQSYSIEKQDKEVLQKFADDLFGYSKGLEQLKNRMVYGEQQKKKVAVTAELEGIYESQKRNTEKARNNLRIIRAVWKKAVDSGVERDIEEARARMLYYKKQNFIAEQLELKAKRDFEQGA